MSVAECEYELIGDGNAGHAYRCRNCGHQRHSKYPPEKLHRICGASRTGPGTHLSRLIARFQRVLPWWNMQPHKGCGCNDTARWMDQLGPDGCEERITEIVKRLKNESRKRKITFPFQGWVAEKMVRWAIRRARKAG